MLTQLALWLNALANACAGVALAPIAWLPGWLSATLVGVVTGVLMLLVFKYTSNQAAIARARSQIKSNLLAISLFKDSVAVGLRSQGGVLAGAGRLMLLSLVPMAVMLVPTCLLLGQLALWYQARPLRVGEEAVVTACFREEGEALRQVRVDSSPPVFVTVGPVRVPAKRMVCWKVKADETGRHLLSLRTGDGVFTKELAVGDGFMPTSLKRPDWSLTDVLLHPSERPFTRDSVVQSIEVAFPERSSWSSGSNSWLIYWFAVSLIAAFVARPFLKVNI